MKTALALIGAAVALVACRIAWGVVDPLHFDVVKSQIYVRDFVCLGPAAALGVLGVRRLAAPGGDLLLRRQVVWLSAGFAFVGCALIAGLVLRGVPAVADEAAYLWQGQVFADGHLWSPVPPSGDASLVQYVTDLDEHRVGVFFPGSSLPLAAGVLLGLEAFVNPLLAGLLVCVSVWATRRMFSDTRLAALTGALFASSPFVLFQGASYFGQVWTALLTLPAFAIAVSLKRRFDPVLVGLLAGLALFSRPLSAVVLGLVVAATWVAVYRRESIARLGLALAGAALPVAVFLMMNADLTGSALRTVHAAVLPDDKPVFGFNIVSNIVFNAAGMVVDGTGLVAVCGGFAAFAAWRYRRDAVLRSMLVYVAAQALAYAFYYNHGISYGPRFLFEISPLVVVLVARAVLDLLGSRSIYIAALAACLTLGGVVPERARIFNDRAEYLDLAGVPAAADRPAVVLIEPGTYRFPDPFYAAFVENGPEPGSQAVTYLRADSVEPCQARRAFPGREIYIYEPFDSSRSDGPNPGELRPAPGCDG